MCWHCHTCSSLLCLLTSSTTLDRIPISCDGHQGSIQHLTIQDKLLWMILYKSLCEHILSELLLKHMADGRAESQNTCMLHFIKNSQTIYTSGCNILHPHQIVKVLVAHHTQGFLTVAITMAIFHIFLMMNNVKHILMYLLTIYIYFFLVKYLFQYSAYFLCSFNVVHLCFPCCFFPSITIKSQTIYKIIIFFGLLREAEAAATTSTESQSLNTRREQPHTAGVNMDGCWTRMDECLNAAFSLLNDHSLPRTRDCDAHSSILPN